MGPSQAPPSARYCHVVFPDEFAAARGPRSHSSYPPRQPAIKVEHLTADERSFLAWLFHTAGLDVRHYKTETLKRRLPACLRVARWADVGAARRVLRCNASLRTAALSALVIGVTNFFRDAPVFDALA